MAAPAHKHYPGFTVPFSTLKIHARLDHGFTDAEIESLGDNLEATHTAAHPEISGLEPPKPDIEVLSQQLVELQNVVDQLILNDLLDL